MEKTADQILIESLEKQLTEVKQERDLTVAINDELSKKVEDLTAQLAEKPEAPAPVTVSDESFEVDGVAYEFAFAKMTTKTDGKVTAAEVLASEGLQKRLVASGSGMIRAKA